MKTSIHVLVVSAVSLLASRAGAAPVVPVSDAGFSAALAGVRTAVAETRSAQKAAQPPSQGGLDDLNPPNEPTDQHCSDAAGLEKSQFTLTFKGGKSGDLQLPFSYVGCREEPRNDLQPPYTERYYRAPNGYTMALVTDEGAESSSVVVAYKGPGMSREAVWNYGGVENSKLMAAGTVDLGQVQIIDHRNPGTVVTLQAQMGVGAAAKEAKKGLCEQNADLARMSFTFEFTEQGGSAPAFASRLSPGDCQVVDRTPDGDPADPVGYITYRGSERGYALVASFTEGSEDVDLGVIQFQSSLGFLNSGGLGTKTKSQLRGRLSFSGVSLTDYRTQPVKTSKGEVVLNPGS